MLALLATAFAQSPDLVLAVDAVLAERGGSRRDADGDYCSDPFGPPQIALSRRFLCRRTVSVGSWTLSSLEADGDAKVSARLGHRRFTGEAAAAEARALAAELYGTAVRGYGYGGLAWCFGDAVWSGTELWTLEYGCGVSIRHVPALEQVSRLVYDAGEPWEGAVGVAGNHSGWGLLVDRQRDRVVLDAPWRHFAKVVGVAADDVLWVRAGAGGDELPPVVGKLAPDATCVPVVGEPLHEGWWLVRAGSVEGFASSRFLEAVPAAACAAR